MQARQLKALDLSAVSDIKSPKSNTLTNEKFEASFKSKKLQNRNNEELRSESSDKKQRHSGDQNTVYFQQKRQSKGVFSAPSAQSDANV